MVGTSDQFVMGGFVYPIILCPVIAYTVLGVSRLA